MPKEFSARFEVSDEIKFCGGLEAEFQADQEGTVKGRLENLALSDGMGHFLLGNDFFLGEDFHRVYPTSVFLSDLENSAERPAPDQLQELKITGTENALSL